jgi:hypothetical protein
VNSEIADAAGQTFREYIRQVEVTLRLTVSQSVSLGVEYLLLFDNYSIVFVGRHL